MSHLRPTESGTLRGRPPICSFTSPLGESSWRITGTQDLKASLKILPQTPFPQHLERDPRTDHWVTRPKCEHRPRGDKWTSSSPPERHLRVGAAVSGSSCPLKHALTLLCHCCVGYSRCKRAQVGEGCAIAHALLQSMGRVHDAVSLA